MEQMENMGYESHNPIVNMGSLSVFMLIYFFKLAFMILVLLPLSFVS